MKFDKYKRLELYLGWKCNQKCFFCVEMPTMIKNWKKVISPEEIGAKLLYFRKLGYNHVSFLGGEPTIQKNYLFAIKFAHKLGYKVLITTNGTMYQFDDFSKKTLKYIDELIFSVPCTNEKLQKKITGTNNYVDFEKVFENVKKYFSGNFLKINTVIHRKNINHLEEIFFLANKFRIKFISISYPEPQENFYGKDFLIKNTLLKYSEINFSKIIDLSKKYDIILTIDDVPICVLGEKYVDLSNDFKYGNRLKIDDLSVKQDRQKVLPRSRGNIVKCNGCKYFGLCWGVYETYANIFGEDEIRKIL